MGGESLILRARDVRSATQWRWVLEAPGGAFLADHAVALDPKRQREVEALRDLPGYLRRYAAPDRRDLEERQLLHDLGGRIGAQVLGPRITTLILERAPVTVRVVFPPSAADLLTLPLDLAHPGSVSDKPLALQDVSLIFEIEGEVASVRARGVGERLRILALFSLPPSASPLNLRRERQMLRQLVAELRGASGKAVELRVLQYGTTRQSLEAALQDGQGWDVLHFSGHGLPGSLVLEKPDGSSDLIGAADLSKLLDLARNRLKLVTLSACLSAAMTIEQTLSALNIEPSPATGLPSDSATPSAAAAIPMSVARVLVQRLDCAVLAMRYAVEDEFATAFIYRLYQGLFQDEQPLALAVVRTLRAVLRQDGEVATGSLSVATPALFGRNGATLELVPPRPSTLNPEPPRLAYFPDERPHFVGRVAAMTRASTALASRSGKSAVLFHGMAGGGKTSCALELAYQYEEANRFRGFVWSVAPKEGDDIALALRDFALALENQLREVLPRLALVDVVDRVEALEQRLPVLTELLSHTAVLIVLDNLESLLTPDGAWRDERWGLVLRALFKPGGLSRVVITSRIRPRDLPASVEVIPVYALPLDEAVLLVRELPNLNRLLHGEATERDLVRRTLRLVQGHPKLIALAEALAAEPARLAAQLDRASTAQDDARLDAFFETGKTRYDPQAFLDTLHQWTSEIAGTLPAPAHSFFSFLCALEEPDRQGSIIDGNWSDVWRQLGQPEPAPSIGEVLGQLLSVGLVERQAIPESDEFTVAIHPGVAEQGRGEADPALRTAVDTELRAFWNTVMEQSREAFEKSPRATEAIVRAGLAAFPYLSRLGAWQRAVMMLQEVQKVDQSPATMAALLPLFQRSAEALTGTQEELMVRSLFAKALLYTGQTERGEALLRQLKDEAIRQRAFNAVRFLGGELINLLQGSGRVQEALELLDEIKAAAEAGGFGS